MYGIVFLQYRNGLNEPSSNPGWGILHFSLMLISEEVSIYFFSSSYELVVEQNWHFYYKVNNLRDRRTWIQNLGAWDKKLHPIKTTCYETAVVSQM